MNKEHAQIRDGIKNLVKSPERVFPGTVSKVNAADCTVDVDIAEGITLFNCKLRAVQDTKQGLIVWPKKGTTVQLCRTGADTDYLVLHADEVEKVEWIIAGVSYTVDAAGFVMKKGNDTLWDCVKLFIEAVEPILVLQGNNKDDVKLALAKAKFKSILNGV